MRRMTTFLSGVGLEFILFYAKPFLFGVIASILEEESLLEYRRPVAVLVQFSDLAREGTATTWCPWRSRATPEISSRPMSHLQVCQEMHLIAAAS
jgi:hypothetical protein